MTEQPRPNGRIADPQPGSKKPDPVLEIDDLQRSFGGIHAVDVDHLEIQRHTVTSLIGRASTRPIPVSGTSTAARSWGSRRTRWQGKAW